MIRRSLFVINAALIFRFGLPVVVGTKAVVVEGEVGVLVRLTFVDEDKASLLVSHDVGRLAQALQQMVMDILAVAVYHLYIVHLVGDGTIIYVLARGPTEHDAVCAYIVLGRGGAEAAGKLASSRSALSSIDSWHAASVIASIMTINTLFMTLYIIYK